MRSVPLMHRVIVYKVLWRNMLSTIKPETAGRTPFPFRKVHCVIFCALHNNTGPTALRPIWTKKLLSVLLKEHNCQDSDSNQHSPIMSLQNYLNFLFFSQTDLFPKLTLSELFISVIIILIEGILSLPATAKQISTVKDFMVTRKKAWRLFFLIQS